MEMEFPDNKDVKMKNDPPEGYKDDDDAYFPVFLVNETTSGGDVLVKLKIIYIDFGLDQEMNVQKVKTSNNRTNFVTVSAFHCRPLPESVILDVEVNLSRVAGTVVA